MYEIERLPQNIDIGFTGEIDFRTVVIDMSAWVAKVPEGQPILMYIRPGEFEAYPVEITFEDNIVTWSVSDEDLGTKEGTGLLQVWFGVEDESQVLRQLGMSAVVATIVHLSLAGEGNNSSTVQIPWLKEVMEMKNIILGYDYEAESWAVGKRGGTDVPATDPAYHNNAKYFSEQASAAKTAAEAAQEAAETAAERDVGAWLEENFTNPDSPPLDRTLALNTCAAPADMVGNLKSAVELNRNGSNTLSKETAKSTFTKITGKFCRVSETGTPLSECLFEGSAYVLEIDCGFMKTITYPVFITSSSYGTAFFDSNDLTISGHYNTSQTTGTTYTIDVPTNAAKCLITIPDGLDSMEWNISYTSPSLKGLDGSVEELIQEQSETNLTLKYLLDTECEYKYFNDGDWGEEIVAYSGKAFNTTGAMGQTVENVTKNEVASLRNYKIDISNYKKVAFPAYKSQSNLGELFADSNDIVCGTYANPTYDSGTIVVVEVPENAKYLYISRNINWDTSICFLIGAVNALENSGGSSVIIVHDDSYPSLTDSEKAEIVSLCEDYYDIRSNFKYGGNYRNQYADSSCISNGQFLINCGNFAQFIWMGRSASDFNPNNYTPYINKGFDWGYYFYFLVYRKCYGIYKNQSAATDSGKYYGYQHPTGSNAYSFNTFDNGNGMRFRPFMAAADLAFELFNMGCEVPRRAVEVGDMIFYRGPEYSGMTNETQLNFRNISHVGICIDNDYNGLGILRVMESTFYDSTGDISIISLDETDTNNRLRAGMYENRIVMCARHPHAFGVPTNVPNAITAI